MRYNNLSTTINEISRTKDDLDPNFLFQSTHMELLLKVANGKIDAKRAAQDEVANRGYDLKGKWVGMGDNRRR
ncbi:MAG: hypothetical protein CMK23_05140 [Porticoccaceae bacterium]|nr:hypothetical protein [Porticoccaceae bacterium]|tara:strand:- start:3500 stop:3718 length:219 start_codon:yes stop_codon:yes gene_type:complete